MNNNRQRESLQEYRSVEGQDETKPTQTPTTTPKPIEPTESDAGSSVIQFPNCSRSAKHRHSEPGKLGDIVKSIMHRYDHKAKSFAADVFIALKLPCALDSVEARRELGCFASLWMDAVCSGIPPMELDHLRNRAIAEAQRLRKYWHNRPGKIQAVWCKIFGDMLNKAKTENQCKAM